MSTLSSTVISTVTLSLSVISQNYTINYNAEQQTYIKIKIE